MEGIPSKEITELLLEKAASLHDVDGEGEGPTTFEGKTGLLEESFQCTRRCLPDINMETVHPPLRLVSLSL